MRQITAFLLDLCGEGEVSVSSVYVVCLHTCKVRSVVRAGAGGIQAVSFTADRYITVFSVVPFFRHSKNSFSLFSGFYRNLHWCESVSSKVAKHLLNSMALALLLSHSGYTFTFVTYC